MAERTLTLEEIEIAVKRRAEFLAALPRSSIEAEEKLPQAVRATKASARSKLWRIYRVADELSKAREPFVACEKGCASCCHMNVTITKAEADRLERAAGRRAAAVDRSVHHDQGKFVGIPCPFLDAQGACTVYEDRPLSCRKHGSFFESAAACHPSVMNEVEVPMVGFSGLDEALFEVSSVPGAPVLADIRDFFPVGA
ncbi:YkgJ family cysteine cluster protein [Rhizobacter sp. P5_C2]